MAAADWSPPENLADAGQQLAKASVHYDGTGRAYAFSTRWLGGANYQMTLREREPGGGPWGPAQVVPLPNTPNGWNVDVAVSPAGELVVAYSYAGQAMVARRPVGGAWQTPVAWSSPGTSGPSSGYALTPSVAIGDDGTIVVAWAAFNSCCGVVTKWRVLGAAYRPGVGWDATPQVWSTSTTDVHSDPAVAVQSNGDAVVSFLGRNSSQGDELWTVDYGGGAWSTPVLRSTVGSSNGGHVDAGARDDVIAIAWERAGTQFAVVRQAGTWSPVSTLTGGFALLGDDPSVAVGANGTVHIAYTVQSPSVAVMVATRPAGGSFTSERINPVGTQANQPKLGANASGDLAIVYDDLGGTTRHAMMELRPAGGSWGTPTQLTTAPSDNSTLATVAVDPWGHALAGATPITQGWGTRFDTSIEQRDPATEPTTVFPSLAPSSVEVGDVLSCSPGDFGGTGPFRYTYQWTVDDVVRDGETSSTYTIRPGDEGAPVSCLVTATNEGGSASWETPEVVVSYTAPTNLTAPSLPGPVTAGTTVTCDPGTWNGVPEPDLTYEWVRGGVVIPDEESPTYDVAVTDAGSTIACRVTATNPGGSAVAASNAQTVPAVAAPVNTVAPSIAGPSRPSIGTTLTCRSGTWTGAPTPTYATEWLRDGLLIPMGYGTTYVVQAADVGSTIACQVTAENVVGDQTVASSNTRVLDGAPVNTVLPRVVVASGSTWSVGGTANCNRGSWVNGTSYGYQWMRDGNPIPGATAQTYVLDTTDAGASISCEVTAQGRMATTVATSAPRVLPSAPTATVLPTVTGTPRPNRTLRCHRGSWQNARRYVISWTADGIPLGSSASTYVVAPADIGTTISCSVTATGPGGTTTESAIGAVITP